MKKTVLAFFVIALVSIVMPIGAQAVTSQYNFQRDLTVGSSGLDVTALQTFLENNHDLVLPSGISKGYFGSLTKAALIKFQIEAGISPAIGYFGKITRGKISNIRTTILYGLPSISVSTSSAPVGTDVIVSVFASATPNLNKYDRADIIFQNASGTASYVFDGIKKLKQITYRIPESINSTISCSKPDHCDPYPMKVYPGVYKMYLYIEDDNGQAGIESNKIDFTVTATSTK